MPKLSRHHKTVFEVDQNITSPKFNKPKASRVSILIACLLFVGSLCLVMLFIARGGWQQLTLRQPDNVSDTDRSSQPDETWPSDIDSYSVPPDDPRLLSIDKIQVRARVQKMGITSDNAIASPHNIHDTGWYERSARPGDKSGAMVVDGHLNGPTLPGVFERLTALQSGDTIEVESGDRTVRRFKVVRSKNYEAHSVDMAAVLKSSDPSKLGLNLIVCSGKIDTNTDQYTQRLVVFAVAEQ